jgi:catechol 2,3-dioxygenase-like lactoylglutathione lyase family enzyme
MPRRRRHVSLVALFLLGACQAAPTPAPMTPTPMSYTLGTIAGFSELVNAGVKKLALSDVLSREEMDRLLPEAERVAARHNVQVYREPELLVTDLFPADVARGKEVLLLYQGTTKDEYLQLKAEAAQLRAAGTYTASAREAIARRFGRLLSYPTWRINELLAGQGDVRTLRDFGIRASNLFLYYRDLERATRFYQQTLGLELVADYQMARMFRVTDDSYLILVDAAKGMHDANEPKTVALALVTDQLEAWHAYLATQGLSPRSPFVVRPGRAHDGFVVADPEGYLLEFERFNPHPENEQLMPRLAQAPVVRAPTSPVPNGLGFQATVTWLYYKDMPPMQTFYEEVLGLKLVVDQGWAKVYEGSRTGYVGLVDERRGMHRATETKAVNVSFILDDVDGWFAYVKRRNAFALRDSAVVADGDGRYRAFVGYDPEGYFMEFDLFRAHPTNARLMPYLSRGRP